MAQESEKQIRERIEKDFGMKFYSEEELERHPELQVAEKVKGPVLSVSDIIDKCNDEAAKLGPQDETGVLFYLCASALRQLVDRLAKHEARVN